MALTVKIKADASHFKKTIAGIEVQASGLTGVMGKLATSNLAFGAALSVAAAGAVALGAGLAFINDSSGKAAGMESLTMQFEVLTGSAQKAKDLIKTFREEAIKSPLNVQDYATAARGFMSYGVAAEKVLPMLKMLGDVAMGNSERFGLLSYAMAQVASNTSLKGDDLRQLVAQGFNPLSIISEKTGRSMMQLRKEMEAGTITYAMVEAALKDVTSEGGRFFGAIEKGAGTTEGKIAKLEDSILGIKVAFGTGFNEGLKSALDATNAFLPKFEEKFEIAGKLIGKALKDSVMGDYDMLSAVGGVVGEAIMAGIKAAIKISASSIIRDGIGGYVGLGGDILNDPAMKSSGKAISAGINSIMGPRTSMADTIQGEIGGGGLSDAVSSLKRLADDKDQKRWSEYLKRQADATDELVRQGKAATKENMKQLMFSR